MNNFLRKISKLETVRSVILLSSQGEPLFVTQEKETVEKDAKRFSYWNEILSTLGQPQKAEFIFNKGTYYLIRTDIGYVIIGLTDTEPLVTIKKACSTILTKLSEPIFCKRVLLNLLSNSADLLKSNIIKELVPYADKEVAAVLIFHLKKQYELSSRARENLLVLICQVLGYCSSYTAVNELNDFLARRDTELNIPGNEIFEAVRISIEQLNQNRPETERPPLTQPPLNNTDKTSEIILPQEEQINVMLSQGEKDKALLLITQLIEKCSQKKQFAIAYKLRDWLIEINPMALTEIIQTAELIETAKQATINKEHLQIWEALTDILTVEEFSSLYHAMTLKTYPQGKAILQQGTNARILFLVNSGQVQTLVANRNRLTPLSIKESGDVIGAGTFFEASVWTISVVSLGCEVFLLSRKKFETLKEHHPSLESKLLDFCSAFQATSTQIKRTKSNRRQFKRKHLNGRIAFAVLDKSAKEVSSEARGNLIDISSGGLAFSIHSSLKKNAVALFGRQLRVSINTGVGSDVIIRKGVVQAVRDMDLIGNEYSLHLEFNEQVNHAEVEQIVSSHNSKK